MGEKNRERNAASIFRTDAVWMKRPRERIDFKRPLTLIVRQLLQLLSVLVMAAFRLQHWKHGGCGQYQRKEGQSRTEDRRNETLSLFLVSARRGKNRANNGNRGVGRLRRPASSWSIQPRPTAIGNVSQACLPCLPVLLPCPCLLAFLPHPRARPSHYRSVSYSNQHASFRISVSLVSWLFRLVLSPPALPKGDSRYTQHQPTPRDMGDRENIFLPLFCTQPVARFIKEEGIGSLPLKAP